MQAKIVEELVKLNFSQVRPPRTILKDGDDIVDITDVLPADLKNQEDIRQKK